MPWILKKDGVELASFPFKPSLDQLTRTLADSIAAIHLLTDLPHPTYTLENN